jgi:lipoprotein-releasing system permease protein
LNLERYIAQRVAANKGTQSFSRVIIRIAVVAVALSMTVMIVSASVINGFKHQVQEKIFGFWGHIHLTHSTGYGQVGDTEPISKNQPFYPHLDTIKGVSYEDSWKFLWWENEDKIVQRESEGGVRHIQVFAYKAGIFKTKEEIEGIILKGVDKDFQWDFFEQYMEEGSSVIQFSDSTASTDILISRQTANRLKLKVDDRLDFYFGNNNDFLKRRFKVCGIYKTGLEDYDKQFALMDIQRIRDINKWDADEVGGFEVFIDDLDDLELMTQYIDQEELPGSIYAQNVRDSRRGIFDWLALQDINDVVILVLMLTVSIINMVTAMLILIIERTNMIGTLKALGQRSWSIRKIFLYYAAYIILIGLFWGNLIGISLCFLQEKYGFVTLSEENYYLAVAPIEVNFWTVLFLNLGTMVITLAFLIIPSYLVTRISPVKALRFK